MYMVEGPMAIYIYISIIMRRKIHHGPPLAWTHDGSGIHSLYLAGGDSGKTRSSLKQKKQECGKGAGLSGNSHPGNTRRER